MVQTLVAVVTPTTAEPFSPQALKDIIECFEDEGWQSVELKRNPLALDEWSVYADAGSDPYVHAS